jgi:ankyrin repeat protein
MRKPARIPPAALLGALFSVACGGGAASSNSAVSVVKIPPAAPAPQPAVASWASSVARGTMTAFDGAGNLVVGGARQEKEGVIASLSPSGVLRWTCHVTAAGTMDMAGVAADRAGNFYVAGSFVRSLDVAGTALQGGERPSIFVAKLTPAGSVAWAKAFGGEGYDAARAVAVDGNGNVYLTGTYQRELSFGGPPLQSSVFRDVFAASLDADGNHRWSLGFMIHGPVETTGTAIAVDGEQVLVAGITETDFGFAPAKDLAAMQQSAFLVGLSTMGRPVFRRIYSGSDRAEARGVAADGAHGITLVGSFSGTLTVDGAELHSAGKADTFVIHLDAGGIPRWSKRFGGLDYDRATSVVLDPKGSSIVGGSVVDSIDLGPPDIGYGHRDALVASFDPLGELQWVRRYGSEGDDEVSALAQSVKGAIAVAGSSSGTLDSGVGTIEAPSGHGAFLMRFEGGQPPAVTAPRVAVATDPVKAAAQAAFAAEREDLDTLRKLVPASVPATATGKDGWPLVMIAAYHGKSAAVQYLLSSGADPNAALSSGYTTLMQAARFGYVDAAKALVAGGAKLDAASDKDGTALHVALDDPKLPLDVARLLVDAKAPLEVKDGRGRTPLLVALDARNDEGVRMLLAAKADVNAADNTGYCALARAATADNAQEVADLLRLGAKPDEPNEAGWTPLSAAAHKGDLAVVNMLLAKGARPRGPVMNKPFSPPLTLAAMNGYLAVVEAILAKGAHPDDADAQGETAAHFAAMNGHTDVLRALKKHGASFGLKDKQGRTVVDVARKGETADFASGRTK